MSSQLLSYFEEVYEVNKDKIYRLCLGFTGNPVDADDLFQETVIKIWHNLDGFRHQSQVSTWIYRVATNTALLYTHRKKRLDNKLTQITSKQSDIEAQEMDLTNEQQINQLHQAIAKLKEIDRIIISLVLEGNSYQEIAEITGLKANNIGVKVNRIKKQLKRYLTYGTK